MAAPINRVVRQLWQAALRRGDAGWSDGQLLDHFITCRDPAAFEALLRRHGPMVLGVCRRVLGNAADAEDAFQATFLVLVRKASSVAPRERVGNWLYGVARRTAIKARAMSAKRRVRERQAGARRPIATGGEGPCADLQAVLDEELARLPEKYRVAVVLCDLQGQTHRAAARALGWPEGTLSTRLTAARRLLARRLTRRGLALSAGALAAAFAESAIRADVPQTLAKATMLFAAGSTAGSVPARVVVLAEGVLRAMWITKVKTMTTVFLSLALLGLGGFIYQGHAGAVGDTQPSEPAGPDRGASAPGVAADPLKQVIPEPAGPVGVVAKIDQQGRLVEITLGADDGVRVGQTLEVYRFKPAPIYVGRVRVEGTHARSCVARRIVNAGAKVPAFAVGDHVTQDPIAKGRDVPRADTQAPQNPRADVRFAVEKFLAAALAGDTNTARPFTLPDLPKHAVETLKGMAKEKPAIALVQADADVALAISEEFERGDQAGKARRGRFLLLLRRASMQQQVSGWFGSDWLVAEVETANADVTLAALILFLHRHPDARLVADKGAPALRGR